MLAALSLDLEDLDWYAAASDPPYHLESNQDSMQRAQERADAASAWLSHNLNLDRAEVLALLELTETMQEATFNAHSWGSDTPASVRDAYRALQLAAGA